MKKLCLLFAGMVIMNAAHAQCPAGRFVSDTYFPNITMDSVTYSSVYNLKMDVYQPVGDTMSARPVIILAHGGSFIGGDRQADVTVDSLCARFAHRGYVTASIDYRLSSALNMISSDSSLAIDEVIKAISDGKAAVRYFRQDKATTNTYKTDTNKIYVGGNSAGAVLYMHVGYLSDISECPSYIVTAMNANGGFDGNSGNPGHSSRVSALINLAGGLNMTSFVNPGDLPSVNAQGDADIVVPYTCAYPNFGIASLPVNVHVQLCGLGSLEPAYNSNGIYHMSHVFPGDGHVPWSTDAAKFQTVDSMVREFLYNVNCTNVVSVNEVNTNAEVSLYPNPASDNLHIASPANISEITLFDQTGRVVSQTSGTGKGSYEINTGRLSKGMYLVKVRFADSDNTPVVKRVIVE